MNNSANNALQSNRSGRGGLPCNFTLAAPRAVAELRRRPLPMVKDLSCYDDQYPSCAETYVTLRIVGNDLDPDEVTELLTVMPSADF
jgi:hypothetical protein